MQAVRLLLQQVERYALPKEGDGLDEVPEVTGNLTIDGIPVTVVNAVESSAFAQPGEEGSQEVVQRKGGKQQQQQQQRGLRVDWLEADVLEADAGEGVDAAEQQQQQQQQQLSARS
uniref:Uncharacterized protein n=1 Tax=Tetradesmus obliquus TaxID=3088 RepID=A0A383VIU8_TETOB|eukprot:jgi/Sobl393_1/1238/SZX65445.1